MEVKESKFNHFILSLKRWFLLSEKEVTIYFEFSINTRKRKVVSRRKKKDLPNNPFAFEVLGLISKQRSKAKKIEVLKRYEHPSLKAILIWNFDESLRSALPEGDVPYTGFEEQASSNGTLSTKITEEVRRMHATDSFSMGSGDKNGHTSIRREFKHFYHFIRGGNDAMSAVRRETMFINILEGLHPLEGRNCLSCEG